MADDAAHVETTTGDVTVRNEADSVQNVTNDQPLSEGAAMMMMIERVARDPSFDIDRLKQLFEMRERIEKQRRIQEYNVAFSAAQSEIKPVAKKLNNKQTSSMYADLAAISDAADPIIHSHGLSVICSEFKSEEPNCLGVRCKVSHVGGHSETYDFNVPKDGIGIKGNANMTATHAYASTLTYGRRYAKCAVFDIATKNDMDGNAQKKPSETISAEQAEELSKLISETQTNIDDFLAIGKLESLSDMAAHQFDGAKAMLLKRRKIMHDKKDAANA